MYLQTGLDWLNHFLKRTELFNKSKVYNHFERWFRLLEKHVFNFSSSTLLSDFCALCKLDIHGLLINFRSIFHLHFESINEQSNYSDFCALEWYHSPTWLTSTCWSTPRWDRTPSLQCAAGPADCQTKRFSGTEWFFYCFFPKNKVLKN